MSFAPRVPHDVEAERAILGAALLAPYVVAQSAAAGLEAESFYREPHRVVWRAMSYVDRDGALDIVTLAGRLGEQGELEGIGGWSYLSGLGQSAPSVTNAPAYVETVLRHARARDLVVSCTDTASRVIAGDDGDDARAELAASLVSGTASPPTCRPEIDSVSAVWDAMRSGRPPDAFLHSPWAPLNSAVRGIYRGELTIVVAQPRTGKSAFCDQWVTWLAVQGGVPGCVFSLEMTHEQMTLRRLACLAQADYSDLQDYRPRDDEIVALDDARGLLEAAPLHTDEAMLTMEQIWSRTKSGVRQHGWQWILIDHAHIVRASTPKANRVEQLGHVGLLGKQIAKDTGTAVLMAAQMNSDLKKRSDQRPRMGDIAYGPTMEQSAATVLGLYRDELHNRESTQRGMAEVLPIKARFGAGEDVRLDWIGCQQRFRDFGNSTWSD